MLILDENDRNPIWPPYKNSVLLINAYILGYGGESGTFITVLGETDEKELDVLRLIYIAFMLLNHVFMTQIIPKYKMCDYR